VAHVDTQAGGLQATDDLQMAPGVRCRDDGLPRSIRYLPLCAAAGAPPARLRTAHKCPRAAAAPGRIPEKLDSDHTGSRLSNARGGLGDSLAMREVAGLVVRDGRRHIERPADGRQQSRCSSHS